MPLTEKFALELWHKYNDDSALLKHALSVAAAMRHFALKAGEDPEIWGAVGVLHDIDYGRYPEEHCVKARELLENAGVEEEYIRAVISHGYGLVNDVEPKNAMEKTLYAVDELTGFVTACALVRPSKSVEDLEVKSVLKKWKTANFAAGVDRSVIERGAEMLDLPLNNLIEEVIKALKPMYGAQLRG